MLAISDGWMCVILSVGVLLILFSEELGIGGGGRLWWVGLSHNFGIP